MLILRFFRIARPTVYITGGQVKSERARAERHIQFPIDHCARARVGISDHLILLLLSLIINALFRARRASPGRLSAPRNLQIYCGLAGRGVRRPRMRVRRDGGAALLLFRRFINDNIDIGRRRARAGIYIGRRGGVEWVGIRGLIARFRRTITITVLALPLRMIGRFINAFDSFDHATIQI